MPDSAIQEIVCCMGQPVAGNPTQFMLQRALAELQLDWCCLTLEVAPDDLEDALRGVRTFGFRGVNLNYPHTMAAVTLLDQLSEAAELIGAVNCIVRTDNRLVGENTDGQAFVDSLAGVCDLQGKRVLILGAGGAARSVAVRLSQAGAVEVRVANRTSQRAQQLVDILQQRLSSQARVEPWETPLAVPDDVDILINATSIGHLDADDEFPLDPATLRAETLVADVVMNPPPFSWLIRAAQERGCQVLTGLDMLVNQGAMDIQIWTGCQPDRAAMREAVEEFLEI